jgi:hypothetical protein
MDSPELMRTIIATLSGPKAQKINFHCGTRTVNGSIFNQVIDRLRKDKIHIDADRSDLDPRTKAEYSADDRTLMFKSRFFGAIDSEQGVIVHESVHAGFHVIGHGESFMRIDNEPSAYLAEAFFLLFSDFSFDQLDRFPEELQLAFTIALNMQSKKQSSVSQDELVLLRNAIARFGIHFLHKDNRFGTDKNKYGRGIPP